MAPPDARVALTAPELMASPEFKALVRRRWAISLALLALLCGTYFGYVLMVAADIPLASRRVGDVTPLAIVLAIGSIPAAWVLTSVYVIWANLKADPAVSRLKAQLKR